MPGHTRLFRRNGTYYLRAKVPEKLRGIIGKREIQESLKTRDYREAAKLIKPRSIRVDLEFEAARMKLAKQNGGPAKPPLQLSDDEIYAIVYDCFIREEKKNEAWVATRRGSLDEDEAEAVAHNLKLDLSSDLPADAIPPTWDAEQFISSYLNEAGQHWQIDPKSETHSKLIDFANRAYVEATRRMVDRIERGGVYQRRDPAFEKITAQSEPPATSAAKSETLGDFLDRFEADKKATKTAATQKAIVLPLRVLREVLGEKTKLASITKEHMAEVADTLRAIPKNMAQRYPGLSIRDAVAAGEHDSTPTRDKATLANNWIHVVSVFNYAKDDGLIEANPAHSKRLRSTFHKSKESTRRPFSTEELNKIFRSPIYTALSESGEIANRITQPERFWIPLLGLFEGCRLNEICQLDTADVQEDGGIAFLFIHTTSESGQTSRKQLKTKESRRRVPIHPIIKSIGFLQFVEKRRADDSNPRLFPSLRFNEYSGRFSSAFSKWFARLVCESCGENVTPRFHSLRHNFRDSMRNASIQDEAAARLGGWKAAGGVMNTYGGEIALPLLRDAIAKVEYPGLQLSHLLPVAGV